MLWVNMVYWVFIITLMLQYVKGFLNNVTFNNRPNSPTLLNIWSVQDSLAGDNLVYTFDEPQYIQIVIQGKIALSIIICKIISSKTDLSNEQELLLVTNILST
jgi:hypothetical protein